MECKSDSSEATKGQKRKVKRYTESGLYSTLLSWKRTVDGINEKDATDDLLPAFLLIEHMTAICSNLLPHAAIRTGIRLCYVNP